MIRAMLIASILKPRLFSFEEAMRYTTRGFDDPRYVVEDGGVSTAVSLDGTGATPGAVGGPAGPGPVVIRVSDVGDSLAVEEVAADGRNGGSGSRDGGSGAGASRSPWEVRDIEAHVRRWFDLDRDLEPWQELVRGAPEPVRSAFGRLLGFRLVALPSLFEALAWCVIGQQINLAFAYRLKRRLSERYASWVDASGRRHYLFPEPAVLAEASREDLRAMQLSYRKADYLIGLARLFRDGELSEAGINRLVDTPTMIAELRRIRGIGEWSAAYGLLKGLGRADAVPFGDSGLRAAYMRLYGREGRPSRRELEELFGLFSGWEGYAAFYLWRTLLTPAG